MKKKALLYTLYIFLTLTIVNLCVTIIFKELHDDGRIGMFIGLIISQTVLPLLLFKTKWYLKLMIIITLYLIPYNFTKLITRKLYALEPSEVYISNKIDVIGYVFYFLIAIIIIELGLAFNPKKTT